MGSIQLDVDGAEVWVETVASEGGSHMGYTGGGEAKDRKSVAPALVAEAVSSLAKGFAVKLDKKKGPQELRVDFGLSLDPNARVVIGQSGTFRVSMSWKTDD